MDRATRPNNPNSEPEMLPDRPLSTVVGRDLSPPPVEMGNSEILASVVPTDEMSASFHSTPDFHNTSQTPDSYIYLEVPTTCISSEFYTGPTPVVSTTTTGPTDFYISK